MKPGGNKGRGNSVAEALELCNDQIVRILAAKKFGAEKVVWWSVQVGKGRGGGLCRRIKMQISGQCRRATSARPCHRTTYIVHPHRTSKRDTRIHPHLTPCLPTTRIVLVTPVSCPVDVWTEYATKSCLSLAFATWNGSDIQRLDSKGYSSRGLLQAHPLLGARLAFSSISLS
jgi:hypothetical protein